MICIGFTVWFCALWKFIFCGNSLNILLIIRLFVRMWCSCWCPDILFSFKHSLWIHYYKCNANSSHSSVIFLAINLQVLRSWMLAKDVFKRLIVQSKHKKMTLTFGDSGDYPFILASTWTTTTVFIIAVTAVASLCVSTSRFNLV